MAWLTSRIHPAKLKHAIDSAEFALRRFYGQLLEAPAAHVKPELANVIKNVGLAAYTAGAEYARGFSPLTKLALTPEHPYSADIDRFLASLDMRLPASAVDIIHESLERGQGLPTEKLAPKLGYETAKGVARSTIMNVYARGALKQWKQDGIKHVKRVAIEDNRTCPVCRGLNGKEYLVRHLLTLPNPQSWDTHLSCRCTFVPVISISTYAPRKLKDIEMRLDVRVGQNLSQDTPIELAGVMEEALRGGPLPFTVRFDPEIKSDYEFTDGESPTLTIHPKTVADEDPREIIWAEAAERLWPRLQARVEKEYRPLVEQGYASSVRSWDTTKELFVNNYTGFRLGQLDNDLWSQVFFRSVAK